MEAGDIQRIELTDAERLLMATLPAKLHAGEREGIVICQVRKHLFLSHDRRAVRYCDANGIEAISLAFLLHSLWINRILPQHEVRKLINTMATVEKLILKKSHRDFIFALRRPRRRGKS